LAYYDAFIAKWATLAPGTVEQKLAALNAETVAHAASARRMLIPSHDLYNAIDGAEFSALVAANQAIVRDLLNMGTVDVSPGKPARIRLLALFGQGTTTRTNLVALAAAYDTPPVPWWQANGYPCPFNVHDLANAGVAE
jgi:hypothetical protein